MARQWDSKRGNFNKIIENFAKEVKLNLPHFVSLAIVQFFTQKTSVLSFYIFIHEIFYKTKHKRNIEKCSQISIHFILYLM